MPRKYIKKDVVNPAPTPIKRRCLKCDRVFMAKGRFNRICPKCHLINQGLAITRYSIGGYHETEISDYKYAD